MKLIIADDQNIEKTKEELVVVIDVLRAFTTACYVMKSNPKDYIIVPDIDSAHKLKKENSNCILMGERDGFNIPEFDYGNSPTEIKDMDFSNRTIVHTTTLGTRGVIKALGYTKEVITGSFVNARAIVNFLKKENPNVVYLFSTNGLADNNEDVMFARYIKGCFDDKPLDMNTIRENLTKNKPGNMYLVHPRTKDSKNDFFLSLELDRFNFILKAHLGEDKLIHLKRINL
jgi:2-phosphosulfolactate phosphatase